MLSTIMTIGLLVAYCVGKIYIDTLVVVALADPNDDFHSASLSFIKGLQRQGISYVIGSPIMLEIAKIVQRRGISAVFTLFRTLDIYEIELVELDPRRLLSLTDLYISQWPLGAKHRYDLLYYASATLLNCTHLASWDKKHFNQRVERRVNQANLLAALTTFKVDDPIHIGKALGFG